MSQSRQDALIRQLQGAANQSLRYVGSADRITWNAGFVAIPWPGGASDSTATAVSHGLGATPDFVIPWTNTPDYNAATFTLGATTFTFRCRSVSAATPGAGDSGAFFWVAVLIA